jgi:hypothetical protein
MSGRESVKNSVYIKPHLIQVQGKSFTFFHAKEELIIHL